MKGKRKYMGCHVERSSVAYGEQWVRTAQAEVGAKKKLHIGR